MSDLIHIISWERFCQKDNLNDLDKFSQFLMQRYPGLLDIRNLNIKQVGPILLDLPENLLDVLIEKSSLLLTHRNESDSISGVDVIFKLLCLIARNNKNLDKVVEKGTVDVVIKYMDLSMHELSKELDTEWLNLFEYLLYFLEIIYDPTFSWRRRKKLYFSETAVMEDYNGTINAVTTTKEIQTWLCIQLHNFSNERDLRNRLLHLLCSIMSGSTKNAQLIISPAIVDTFTFQSDINADVIASFCFLISCLVKIPSSERQEELSVVVSKLLKFLKEKSDIRNHELRCIHQSLDGNIELCEEFIICDIFSVFERCINVQENDRELCRLSFMILSKLTGIAAVRQQFIIAKGYDKVLSVLLRAETPTDFVLDLVFSWAVCAEFNASKISADKFVIRDGSVVSLLVKWALTASLLCDDGDNCLSNGPDSRTGTKSVTVDWKTIFANLNGICVRSRRSISECCRSGVISVLCDCIKLTCKRMDYHEPGIAEESVLVRGLGEDLLTELFNFLELLADFSLCGTDLHAIIGLLKDKYSRTRSGTVIKMLNIIVSEVHHSNDVNCWFEFSDPDDCILIAPVKDHMISSSKQNPNELPVDKDYVSNKLLETIAGKINGYSFSFHCWINLSPVSALKKVDSGHERSCIFRLITENSNGFEIFLNMDGQLLVATCHQGEYHYVQVTTKNSTRKSSLSNEENLLKPNKWHMLDFVFQNTRNFFGKATVTVYIDGQNVNTIDLKYPQINEKISVFHIGGCPKSISKEMLTALNIKKSKPGFLNNSSQKRTWLGEEHNVWGRLSSPLCRIATVACINDALTDLFIMGLYNKGPMFSQALLADEQLSNNIIVNYHALAYDPADRSCHNLHPYIQSSKNDKFHCGYLIGERLNSVKLEVAINEIGGVPVILPIIEQLDTLYVECQSEDASLKRTFQSVSDDLNIFIEPDQNSDVQLENSSIMASIVILLRKMSQLPNNQKHMDRAKCMDIIGALMQTMDTRLLDMNVVIAFHTLADQCRPETRTSIYQMIILDWRIWSRCDHETRYKHCLFIASLVKIERPLFRKLYGVTFFLDAIRLYHCPSVIGGVDVTKRLRSEIYGIIYCLVHKHAVIQDYQKLVKFLHDINNDSMIQEILELLTRLYYTSSKDDQDTLLLFESKLMESLFVILIRDLSTETKEATIKFLHLIITSDRVRDKHKDHLLLTDISFASIFIYKEFYESPISAHSIQQLLDILRKAAAKDLFGVVQFLSLLTLSPIYQRINAMRMLKSFFDKSTDATIAISQQPGWQDILIHMFVSKKREDVGNNNDVVRIEDLTQRTKVLNTNTSGFRRSSTWAFDESINLNNGFQKAYFDEIIEEDEDYSLTADVLESTADDSQEVKSIETMYLHRKSLESNDNVISIEENNSNLSLVILKSRSMCGSFSGSEDITNWPKQSEISLESIGKETNDDNYPDEELVQLILQSLHMVIWSVLNSSTDDLLWMTVHQVMESLRSVNERYVLLKSVFYIKQRILIGLLTSTVNLYRTNDIVSQHYLLHVDELIRLIVDSSCLIALEPNYQYEIELLELTITLLQDCLKVWDEDRPYPELAALGFHYLLTLCCSHDLDIVSAVCAKLHQIITTLSKNIIYDEISFIVVHLDRVLKNVIDTENYYFIAPILKTMMEHHGDMLQLSMYLGNISIRTPDFYDYFKDYCQQLEWNTFVKSRLYSASEIYESSYLHGMTTGQSLWRAQANEQTSLDRKKRRAISVEHKKLFQTEIIDLSLAWIKEERRLKDYKANEQQKQNDSILKHWHRTKQLFTSIKGCWRDEENPPEIHLKQSCRENYLRMRPRFDINTQFDSHHDASMERDHPCRSPIDLESDTLKRLSTLERRFDFSELTDDQLCDDEWISIQNIGLADINNNTTTVPSPPGSTKKSFFDCPCKMVTITEVVAGKFELTNTHLIFQRSRPSNDPMDSDNSIIKFSINQIREVHLRRYNLQRSAIEIFLTDQTNYFFNFDAKKRDKVYSKIVSQRPPNLIYSKARSPADLLKSSNLTQRWVNREISNFEYLMQLNTIAGRTYNDMSQYPVFPWIIADYTSPKLDLNNPKTFRDLSKPIGVVNPKHETDVREKYESFEDPSGIISKFHYGTHYSVSAGVMHYLVRMEPFTTMHIHLQSGKFDAADRQFHSIPLSWSIIMDSPNDNKELIPEFFYQPQFLKNENNFNFGLLQQTKTPIDDVELPAWASSPEDFIYQHRQALECEHVSMNLHHWIDLIFGFKQKGTEAVKALNVFYYATYEGVIDFDKITDPYQRESFESMINNFGQTPCQLLKTAHPRRMTLEELKTQMLKIDKFLPVMSNTEYLKHSSKPISDSTDPITFLRVPFAQTRSLISADRSLGMITIHKSNIVVKHNWTTNTKGPGSTYTIDLDSTFDQPNARRKSYLGKRNSILSSNNQLYAVTPDCKYVIAGGNIENRLTIMSLSKKQEPTYSATPHHDSISCISIDIDSVSHITSMVVSSQVGIRLFGITGSLDSTCAVWDLSDLPSVTVVQVLYGHSDAVVSVGLSMYLDVAVSGSRDGTANVHSVTKGQFLHCIVPGGLTSSVNLAVNAVLLSRLGHVYVQWQNGSDVCRATREPQQQLLSLYSLHGQHISTNDVGCSPVTVVSVVPVSQGSLDWRVLVGNEQGQLSVLDGHNLTEVSLLRFNDRIMDAGLLSVTGQYLGVALASGILVVSEVNLSKATASH